MIRVNKVNQGVMVEAGGLAGDCDTQTRENKLHLRETELVLSWRGGSKSGALRSVPDGSLALLGRDGSEEGLMNALRRQEPSEAGLAKSRQALLPTRWCGIPPAGSSRRWWSAGWWCSKT